MPVRPELLATFKSLVAQANPLTGSASAALFQQAADVFAGSHDPEELDQRFYALGEVGNRLRRTRQLPEAEVAYLRMRDAVRAEGNPGLRPAYLASYFVGLVRGERDNPTGSAEALAEALAGFRTLPNSQQETSTIANSLGLALVRSRQWVQAAEILRPLAEAAGTDAAGASTCHNLALALTYGGQPAEGARWAHRAAEIHASVEGAQHPNVIESRMVEGLALVEASDPAGLPLLQSAAAVILAGPGEGHSYFARVLINAARGAAHAGDGVAAEGLARRALYIISTGDTSPAVAAEFQYDATMVIPLWRTLPPATSAQEIRYWRVDFQHTLRRYQAAALGFEPSGDLPKTWYFFVPAHVSATDAKAARHIVQLAFAEANAGLNAREPADANVLDVTALTVTEPVLAALQATAPIDFFPRRSWEAATAWSTVQGSFATALSPAGHAAALLAFMTLHGARPEPEPWIALGLDTELVMAAINQPEETLRVNLWVQTLPTAGRLVQEGRTI